MQEYNKKNLRRLIALFSAAILLFLACVTASVSVKFWWASFPTSAAAIATAVLIFKKGFYDPDKED